VGAEVKTLVLTITVGPDYSRLAQFTHPTLRAYAERIGADFKVLGKDISVTTPHWEKFQIAGLLDEYDRILYLDTDIIVREDCENLFDLVPETHLGMFNEAPFTDRSKELILDCCRQYGISLPSYNGKYYNSGVMVISRRHRTLFVKPEKEVFSFFEQTYLNMMIAFY
jgi:lipopolysaccharide biosynthesis glycosyltransferase